jgi:nucleoside-diphosphate-sugar epimerase
MIGIIGHKGFIGSALIRACQKFGYEFMGITRLDVIASNCDVIIDCNGNSKKFEVNANRNVGYISIVGSVIDRLKETRIDQDYVYISSGEVYGFQQKLSSEIDEINLQDISDYGMLKYEAEKLVRQSRNNHIIVRPSGFVGVGLQKNPIYDLLNGNKLYVHPESCFQFCDVDWFADTIVWLALNKKFGVWNVSAKDTITLNEVSAITKLGINQISVDAKIEHHELALNKLQNWLEIPSTRAVVSSYIESVAP